MQGQTIHRYLLAHGWQSVIIYSPDHILTDSPLLAKYVVNSKLFTPGDIVPFRNFTGPHAVALARTLREQHVHVVFIDCDYPAKLGIARSSTATVCSSDTLANFYLDSGVEVVRVLPESYEQCSSPRIGRQRDGQIRCVWFGSLDMPKTDEIHWLRSLLKRHFPLYRLIVVSGAPQADYQWSLDTAWQIIANADIAVITGNDSLRASCKSSNRVIQAMALGLPVIAFPLPSYACIIRHDRNGLLCRDDEEWITALSELGSARRRERLGKLGYRYARRFFSPSQIGAEWMQFFVSLATTPENPSETSHAVLFVLCGYGSRFTVN